jgi:hypothetical protein
MSPSNVWGRHIIAHIVWALAATECMQWSVQPHNSKSCSWPVILVGSTVMVDATFDHMVDHLSHRQPTRRDTMILSFVADPTGDACTDSGIWDFVCHGPGHGHGVFISATSSKGKWTTNPTPSFTLSQNEGRILGFKKVLSDHWPGDQGVAKEPQIGTFENVTRVRILKLLSVPGHHRSDGPYINYFMPVANGMTSSVSHAQWTVITNCRIIHGAPCQFWRITYFLSCLICCFDKQQNMRSCMCACLPLLLKSLQKHTRCAHATCTQRQVPEHMFMQCPPSMRRK